MQSFFKKYCFVFTLFFGANIVTAQDTETGIAAYYSDEFDGGSTASNESYDKNKLTAAHNTIPFGTIVKVTNLSNGKSVRVRVNDRGPYIKGRIIDVSSKAAKMLGMMNSGEARVKIEAAGEENTEQPIATTDIPKEYQNDDVLTSRGTIATIEDAPKKTVKIVPKKIVTTTKKKALKVKKSDINETDNFTEPNDITIETDISTYVKTNNNVKPTFVPKGYDNATNDMPRAILVKGKDFKTYDLYQIKLLRPAKKGFGVQVASFDNYEAALKEIAVLQGLMYDNVLVSIEKGKDGKPDYKVLVGAYADKKAAEVAKNALIKKIKSKGFVVDLAAR